MHFKKYLHIISLCLVVSLSACKKQAEPQKEPKLTEAEPGLSREPIAPPMKVELVPPKPKIPSLQKHYIPKSLPEYERGSIAEEEALLDERENVILDYTPVWPPQPPSFAELLVQAALERTTHDVRYDGSYFKMAYPMGDVPDSIGVCTDVIIRSYRQLGIDLQELLHKDIRRYFNRYPNQSRWGLSRPDTNIDHRRVPNLRVFFERYGESLPVTGDAFDYKPGDLVTWQLNETMVHIGIVAYQYVNAFSARRFIIHNIGSGPELSDMLFDYEITGHYRYQPEVDSD